MPTINHFDYFTDIEKAFIRRRGKHLMIGPLDWALIESWETREIPLRIVLRAIDEVFDSFEQRGDNKTSVKSLKYCADAVERHFSDWSRSHVGKPESPVEYIETDATFSASHIRAHIEKLNEAFLTLDSGFSMPVDEGLENIRSELAALKVEPGSEEELDRLDDKIDSLLLENKDVLLNQELRDRVYAKLAAFGIDAQAAAAERVICWAIKEEYGIPRLSLFRL